jgi:prepilin-type N-terminal cleavage/methylation domain-containing protein
MVAVRAPKLQHQRNPGRGFTLIELLVVVAIIALLISILLPALGKARQQGKEAVCRSNLHQLALASTYYADENQYHLPYMRGTPPDDPEHAVGPYYQYDQIFVLWRYLKDLKNFNCPSARDKNSTRDLDLNATDWRHSYYIVQRVDDYMLLAERDQWWPWYRRSDYTGKPKIDKLWTEYWFNDWGATAKFTDGTKVPQISGGLINKLPHPNYTVIIADGAWDAYELRHMGATEFAFLDCHVERLPRAKYGDPKWEEHDLTGSRTDVDAFGTHPFWAWGLSRTAYNGGGFYPQPP